MVPHFPLRETKRREINYSPEPIFSIFGIVLVYATKSQSHSPLKRGSEVSLVRLTTNARGNASFRLRACTNDCLHVLASAGIEFRCLSIKERDVF